MAIISTDKIVSNYVAPRQEDVELPSAPEKPQTPTFSETVKAGFIKESIFASKPNLDRRVDESTDFNPLDSVEGTGYAKHATAFSYADSEEDVNRIKSQIDRENHAEEVLANSGFLGVAAQMAASVLDPTILIPGTAAFKAARLGKIGFAAKGALSGAALATGAVGIQESILQSQQYTRTEKETMTNIFFASAVGGIMGGALGALAKPARLGTQQVLKDIDAGMPSTPKHAGAAQVKSREQVIREESIQFDQGKSYLKIKELESIEANAPRGSEAKAQAAADLAAEKAKWGPKVWETVYKNVSSPIPALRSPTIEGLTSPFGTLKKLTNDLFDHQFNIGKSVSGEGRETVESALKLRQAKLVQLESAASDEYIKYTGVGGKGGVVSQSKAKIKAATGETLSRAGFNEEVSKVLDTNIKSDIPEVNKVSAMYRKELEGWLKEMQDLDIISKDISKEFAMQYFPRWYDAPKIHANRAKFKELIQRAVARGDDVHKAIDDPTIIESVADDIITKILGQGDDALGMSALSESLSPRAGKFKKPRTLNFSAEDNAVMREFTVNDASAVVKAYSTRAAGIVEFKKMLQRNGYDSVQDLRKELQSEAQELMDKNPSKSAEISKDLEKALNQLNDFSDIVHGTIRKGSGKPVPKALRTLRKFNMMAMLGGVLLSSIPDMAMAPFKHGIGKTLVDGYAPMFRNLKKANLSANELKDFGNAIDMEASRILKSLQDGNLSDTGVNSKLDNMSQDATTLYMNATGLPQWNTFGKRVAGNITKARILKTLDQKVKGKIGQKEENYLGQLGIPEEMQSRIQAQWKKYGDKESGSYMANLRDWDDVEAASAFGKAVVKDVDSTIVTPGMGDIPRFIQKSELAATIFQFKSFTAAATNKIFLKGLQERDARTLAGVMMLMTLGYTSYVLKQKIKGKDVDLSSSAFVSEGVSRSGMLGLSGDYVAALNPWGTGSRYAGRNTWNILGGPSAGVVQNIHGLGTAVAQGKFDESSWKKTKKLIPFNNVFYLNALFGKANEK